MSDRETKKAHDSAAAEPVNENENVEASELDEQELLEPQPSLLGCCLGCFCCLLCTPIIVLCCCCCGANAAVQKARGRRWDGKQGQWVVDNLEKDASTLQSIPEDDSDIISPATDEPEEKPEKSSSGKVTVVETAYYEALGVAPDADESKVRCY